MSVISLVLEGTIPDDFAGKLDVKGVKQIGKEVVSILYKGKKYPLLLIRAEIKGYKHKGEI